MSKRGRPRKSRVPPLPESDVPRYNGKQKGDPGDGIPLQVTERVKRAVRKRPTRGFGDISTGYSAQVKSESPEEYTEHLELVESGEHRTRFIMDLGQRCAEFHAALTPKHFARVARALFEAATDSKNTLTVRMKATIAMLRPLQKLVRLMPQLRTIRDTRAIRDLEERFLGYMNAFDKDDFKTLADSLVEMATCSLPKEAGKKRRSFDTQRARIVTANTLLTTLMDSYEALLAGAQIDGRARAQSRVSPEKRRDDTEADAFLKEVDSEIVADSEAI